MQWNLAAECISVVFLVIIWAYSRQNQLIQSLKNRMFRGCFLATFCAMSANILSTTMLAFPEYAPRYLTWIITMIYFAATPLMGMAYFFYAIATVYEERGNALKIILGCAVPGVIYLICVLMNPFTKSVFDIYKDGTYSQGPYIKTTYIIFYIYCVASLVLAVIKRRWVEKPILKILTLFPIIAFVVILIQQVFPSIILSGSAATCVLLIIYLYLQNKQTIIDYLTNIPNRQQFLKLMEVRINKNEKDTFAVIILSLRGFRQINDTFGQSSGDGFLKVISTYLQSIIEPQNLFRFSGDEFAILVEEPNNENMERIIQTLRARMLQPWCFKEYNCIIQSAFGVVMYPDSAVSVEGLINGIEYAVYKAKTSNSDIPYYCGQEMLEELRRRDKIVEILKDKIKHNSLDVFYQPIMSTKTHKFVLAESLLRIVDSPIGPIFPDEFIPIAEETGMIIEMTYQVLDKVCKFINRLENLGIELEGIHVNFSALQFNQIDLIERMSEIIEGNETPYSKIKVEITESVLSKNNHLVIEFAEEMHKRGVLLGLDDFGTGYSNIGSVMDTPLDTVKIDKSIIWASANGMRSEIMLKSMTQIFHQMDLKVVAEGVETEEQNRFSEECEIDLIQGYYFARPMPEEDAIKALMA